MQQIRLYCKARDKENPSRYEMTETQILRFKKNNTNKITFKLYDYCKNGSTSDTGCDPYEWLIRITPNSRMIPDSFDTKTSSSKVFAEIINNKGETLFKFDYVGIKDNLFSIKIPEMVPGRYELIVTYSSNDVFSKTFPMIITN